MVTIQYITLIINTSIVTNVFRKPWEHSIIIPVHKSGDIEELRNFRKLIYFQSSQKNRKSHLNSINGVLRENYTLLNESQYMPIAITAPQNKHW